ncbi:MAG: DUF91 domain-containing protein [Mariniphaga sp.]|nr:DUF91 domain-containing protein [Mariniphaga sp.]
MVKLMKSIPSSEKELHSIIKENLESIEVGLKLLEYEKILPKGIPDFLCVDSGGRLVIIEVKLHQDENILFQGLRYYNDVFKNRDALANIFKNKNIDAKQLPRIILIAENFSDDIRNLTTLVTPTVELYLYQVVKVSDEQGIVFMTVTNPKVEGNEIYEPPKLENIIEYLKNKSLLQIIEKIRQEIQSINPLIEEYITYSYIGYKYKGQYIGSIKTQRQSFDFEFSILDEDGSVIEYSSQRIAQIDSDYSDSLKKVLNSYEILKKLKG